MLEAKEGLHSSILPNTNSGRIRTVIILPLMVQLREQKNNLQLFQAALLESMLFGLLTVPRIHIMPVWQEYHPPKPIGRTTRLALRRQKLRGAPIRS